MSAHPPAACNDDVVERLKAIVGPKGWHSEASETASFLDDWRGRWAGHTPLVLAPATTAHVAEILKLCSQHAVAVVPQSGATGLVGAHLPFGEVLLSTRRLNRIRSVIPEEFAIIAEAGVTLAEAQGAAMEAGLELPLSLASEGSARLGGLINTNAGGVRAVRYGVMRDLVLDVEAVTGDGRIIGGAKTLRKNVSGYDLPRLVLGSEGTLAIVTAAALKLVARPPRRVTLWVGLEEPSAALSILRRLQEVTGHTVSMAELMSARAVGMAAEATGAAAPFQNAYPWALLLQADGVEGLSEALETALADLIETGAVADAVMAKNETEAERLLYLREEMSEAQKAYGASIKCDIAVPLSEIPAFLKAAAEAGEGVIPGSRPVFFGHVGDGNIHANVTRPEAMSDEDFLAHRKTMEGAIHDVALRLGGTVSAEHGLGRAKPEGLAAMNSAEEIAVMRAIKTAFDPAGILNPGVLFETSPGNAKQRR